MKPGFTVWLEDDGDYVLGEKEAKILEGIKKFGSLMAASRSLGVTYVHAWNLIDGLSGRIGKPVVKAKRGGESGGGMSLTETGDRLLGDYQQLEERVVKFLGAPKERIFGEFKNPDLSVIGSSCIGVKILLGLIKDLTVEYVEVGSTAGLMALMLGEADVSGIHLYDEETGSYNIPFIKRDWPEGTAALIRGYRREQGLMLKKGNPKKISGIADLCNNVRIVNRNPGSGTRSLLDRKLKENGVESDSLRGYEFEVRSHEEVARAVVEGRADVGLGLKATASTFGLDFIKIAEENFDFAVERRRLGKDSVKVFIEALGSRGFSEELRKRAAGIRTMPDTGKVIYC